MMREAKARKRLQYGCAPGMVEVGRVEFDGPLFGGKHSVVLMARTDADAVDLMVDGTLTCTRTARGVRALLMRRIARC